MACADGCSVGWCVVILVILVLLLNIIILCSLNSEWEIVTDICVAIELEACSSCAQKVLERPVFLLR